MPSPRNQYGQVIQGPSTLSSVVFILVLLGFLLDLLHVAMGGWILFTHSNTLIRLPFFFAVCLPE